MEAAAAEGKSQGLAHIAILPTPGMGHLIPLAEFAKHLLSHHKLTSTFLMAGNSSKAQRAFLDALPEGLASVALPASPLDDLPDDAKIETRITLTISRALPAARDSLRDLQRSTNLVAFVTDLFGTDALDVAREFRLPAYIFFPSNAMVLSLFLRLPEMDVQNQGVEYRDLPDPVRLPGCVPLHGKDLLDPIQDRKNEAYACVLHQTKQYRLADGIFLNSFEDMEPGAIKALREAEPGRPPVYPVGPLVQTRANSDDGPQSDPHGCVEWLDRQPPGSVLFVSFGSGGTLPSEQMTELALGLEASGQRFIWVARSPSDRAANATYFSVNSANDPLAFLPEGFVERTQGVGLVVPSWAPQVKVLGHASTGGFLTHCGWNSTLEAAAHGVPMVAWPLYAEQRMNAVMLVEGVRVALRPREREEDGVVVREEVSRVVKMVMEGEEGKRLRERARQLQEGAARALAEGGSSYKALAEVADRWKTTSTTTL